MQVNKNVYCGPSSEEPQLGGSNELSWNYLVIILHTHSCLDISAKLCKNIMHKGYTHFFEGWGVGVVGGMGGKKRQCFSIKWVWNWKSR